MVKACIVWYVLGLCSGILVGDWLRLRFGTGKPSRRAQNTSQRVMQRARKPSQMKYEALKAVNNKKPKKTAAKHNKAVESLK